MMIFKRYNFSSQRLVLFFLGLTAWLIIAAAIVFPSKAIAAPEDAAVHRVQAGDTLPRLCWQYKVRLEIIEAANPGVTDPLPIGRRLVIPLGATASNATLSEPSVARKPSRKEKENAAAWEDAFVAPATPVARTASYPSVPAPRTSEPVTDAAPPRAKAVPILRPAAPAVAVVTRPTTGSAVAVARAMPAAPRVEMAAVSRPGATTILPPQPIAHDAEVNAADSAESTPPAPSRSAIRPVRSAADIPPPPSPGPTSTSVMTTPPASRLDQTPSSGGLDFLGESRRLAARGLRYNGHWTPPGQRSDWVMDCSNTSRYLYQTVAGIDIGRTASDQYDFLRQKGRAWDVPMGWDHKPRLGYLREHLRAGDLLFWENTYKPVRKPDITHVMVFLGEDAQGRWQMAGSQTSRGVNIYHFDAQAPKGGYSSWFGLVHHEGRFVAYGRPLE